MFKNLLLACFLLSAHIISAQTDTMRITTYNVLHYGRPQANRYALKNISLQPILATIKPSIICFNEVDTALKGALDTINTIMPYAMNHGPVHNTTNTDIIDGLFWKSGKFRLVRDTIICNYLRDIVAYDLYYDDPLLGNTHDTVKVKIITAHLKSSNAVADRVVRDTETRIVMRYLNRLTDTTNFVMLGDFNLYKSSEAAYQNLTATTNTLARLNDPTGMPGNWDENAAFAAIHTQSPRTTQLSDQGASGGLDSRFDFLLVSDAMMNGTRGIRYIPGTYTAFGNDGQHYDKTLTDAPAHPSLPASIIQALYNCADHLPVYADFTITPKIIIPPTPNAIAQKNALKEMVTIANPFSASIYCQVLRNDLQLSYQLLSSQGALIQSGLLDHNAHAIDVSQQLPAGLYFLQLRDNKGNTAYWKLLHN